MTREWISYDLYPGDVCALTSVVTEVVASAVRVATATGAIHRWHYLHYTDDLGPHVRFRLAGSRAELDRVFLELDATVHHSLARVSKHRRDEIMGLPGHSGCQASVYEPEFTFYGGLSGMDLAERIFQRSSEFALGVLQGPRSTAGGRRAISLLLLHRWTMLLAGPAGYHAFLRSFVDHWSSVLGAAAPLVRDAARRNPDAVARVFQWVGSTQVNRDVGDFVTDAHRLLQDARSLPVDFQQVSFSHMHLTSNRLGVSIADELHHALLLLGTEPLRSFPPDDPRLSADHLVRRCTHDPFVREQAVGPEY